jgi:hypothetical protein
MSAFVNDRAAKSRKHYSHGLKDEHYAKYQCGQNAYSKYPFGSCLIFHFYTPFFGKNLVFKLDL